jgi:hypothetical protein
VGRFFIFCQSVANGLGGLTFAMRSKMFFAPTVAWRLRFAARQWAGMAHPFRHDISLKAISRMPV